MVALIAPLRVIAVPVRLIAPVVSKAPSVVVPEPALCVRAEAAIPAPAGKWASDVSVYVGSLVAPPTAPVKVTLPLPAVTDKL